MQNGGCHTTDGCLDGDGFAGAPGGIRDDLATGDVTFAEAFSVQPFGNSLVTMTLTGAQIEHVLEQQVWPSDSPHGRGRILRVSDGFRYTWDPERPVVPTNDYRVTVKSFLADGGRIVRLGG